MKLTSPFPFNTISQGFGKNYNSLYAASGLKGHTGIDFAAPYGMKIPFAADSFCYSVLNKNNPDLSKFRAVYTLIHDGEYSYEVSYGHCVSMEAVPKTQYIQGVFLGNIGNTGDVFSGAGLVTTAAKLAGSQDGAHLHFQVRKLMKIPIANATIPGAQYITDANGIYIEDGCYYMVPDYNNGYHGCVDPMPFFTNLPAFTYTKNLWLGMNDSDVLELQKKLGVDYSGAPGLFGPRTRAAVVAYQIANGIPSTGFVGPLTRARLNT